MTRGKRIERVDSAKQEMESLMNKINQTAEFAENLVQRRSAVDIIHNKKQIETWRASWSRRSKTSLDYIYQIYRRIATQL